MNNSLDKALYYLTGNGNIDAVTVEELEKLVNNHPYFPVAHFLLSKKFKNQSNSGFLPQVQKTALYFPNPYWLHYQLLNNLPDEPIIHDNNESSIYENRSNKVEEVNEEALHVEEFVSDAMPTEEEPSTPATEHPITTAFSPDELAAASNLAQETLKEDDEQNVIPVDVEVATSGNETFENNEAIDDEVEADKTTTYDEHEPVEESKASETINDSATAIVEEATSSEVISDSIPPTVDEATPVSHEHNETVSQAEEEAATITRDIDQTTTEFLNKVIEETPADNVDDENQNTSLIEDANDPEEDEHEKMFQNIKAMLDASSEEANAEVKGSVVPIDPYYTIDYFAAQGIKLDLEKNPQDKLGKQVKKFTQWLKHMKKLGPEDAIATESPSPAEVEAQQTADASNVAKEVVTEAMALVLEKQGKTDKAIQLYRKLTFLNPHKSAYFADKINHLNSL